MTPRTALRGTAASAGPRTRGRWVGLGIVVVAAAAVVSLWRAGALSAVASSASTRGVTAASATALVVRRDVAATTPVAGTLGYAGTYAVTGRGGGTLTWLPQPGLVISQGKALYQVNNASPVVLLYGTVPDWRAMSEGITGADVSQLNRDLAALGDASSSDVAAAGWDYYSAATGYGVQRLEEHLGVPFPSDSLSPGQVVFEPGAIRVTQVTGNLGGPAAGPILQGSSDEHVVMIPLDVSEESQVKTGDAVTVTLPDGATTPGVVSSVGTVATTSGTQQNPAMTIPVTVALTDRAAAGSLDQAPVTVYITTAYVRDVLAVPVTALLAHAGGYDVEVLGSRNTRRWIPVTPGIFDDSSGLVQVTGELKAGQRVVVASS